jgi:hypothetical protein
LLKGDRTTPFETRLSVGIHTDTRTLLYDAALIDDKTLHDDVAAAVKESIVSDEVQQEFGPAMRQLRTYREAAEEFNENERPKKLLGVVSRFFLEDKLEITTKHIKTTWQYATL